jgi:catechol 2,3-dioxygenase-like lactoylglutathione lyase family enzyme
MGDAFEHLAEGTGGVCEDVAMTIEGLTPYAHVADVGRSVEFYGRLGLELCNSFEQDGKLVWAYVISPSLIPNEANARLMLAQADEPVDASQQSVLFYCWHPDVEALHDELAKAGVEVGDVEHPSYMPAGEFSLTDPDGYVLVVGQLD